jgi:hypothetical protein
MLAVGLGSRLVTLQLMSALTLSVDGDGSRATRYRISAQVMATRHTLRDLRKGSCELVRGHAKLVLDMATASMITFGAYS